MSSAQRHGADDADLERALAGAMTPDGDVPGCPPAEVLAGLAEGRLPEAARPAVERHLAACALCRAIAVGLGHSAAPRSPSPSAEAAAASPPAPGARRRPWILIAALLALGAGLVWWLTRDGGGATTAPPPPAAPRDVEAELEAATRIVAQARPDLFERFAPLRGKELDATSDVNRGGIAVIGPRETVLSTRPRFRWRLSGRAQVYTLVLRGEDGVEAWSERIEGAASEFPAARPELPRGSSWMWSVRARRATGPVEGSLGFRVASEAEARRFAEQVAVVRERAPADLADLLAAHVALRAGLLEEAERLLLPRAARGPQPPIEQQTLAYVQVRLGTFPEDR